MKRINILLSLAIFCINAQAQTWFANDINKSLEIVIGDYPNLYANIKGDLIGQHGSTSAYTSRVQVPGAISVAVTINSSFIKDDVNWKAVLFQSKDFTETRNRFAQYFENTRNGIINSGTDRPYILSGIYKEPQPSKPTLINLQLLPATLDVKNLVVELFMEKVEEEWLITLSVYNR